MFCRLIHNMCLIMFVFLRPEICRRLPSDSTSRWTPLPLANGWQLIAPITDLNRQIYSPCSAHKKKQLPFYKTTASSQIDETPKGLFFLFFGCFVFLQQFILNIHWHQLVACKFHTERSTATGKRTQCSRIAAQFLQWNFCR